MWKKGKKCGVLIEAIAKIGFWFNVEAGPRVHAKPDDASILIFKGAP